MEETKQPPSEIEIETDSFEDPPAIQVIPQKFKNDYRLFDIYLFPCNNCNDGVQALHEQKCLKPSCGEENHYYDDKLCPDTLKWSECLNQIVEMKGWMNNHEPK